jgi:protocatechuate 3,4-dioxygenase beta subunit
VASKPGLALTWGGWLPGQAPNQDDATVELVLTAPEAVAGVVHDAAGKPVADAVVWVKEAFQTHTKSQSSQITLSSSLARRRFQARTGADGRFRIEGLPVGAKLDLAITKPGLALDRRHASNTLIMDLARLKIEAGQSDVVLTVKPAGAIQGRVVKSEGGAPVHGARVTLSDLWDIDDSAPAAISGPDGAFHLADLEAGEYWLQARLGTNEPPDMVCEPESVTVEADVTNRAATLALSVGGVLEVTVKNADDEKPIAGAVVYGTVPGVTVPGVGRPMKPVTSSEKGVARLRLPPGSYTVFATKERQFVRVQVTVELNKTNQTTASMTVPKAGVKLTGTVVDSAGKPAPNVAVLLFPFFLLAEKRTDAQGRFELEWTPEQFRGGLIGQWVLIARDPARNLAVALDLEEGATDTSLRLEPALTLAGRVTDPDDKPVANAQATLMFRTDRMLSAFGTPARTDAQGRFEIKGLPPGRPYSVTVSAIGFGQDNENVEAADTATNRVELETFQLPLANLRLAGMVVDAHDKPVADAMINTSGGSLNEQPVLTGRTDSKGHFSFEHVCPGPITLTATNPREPQAGHLSAEGGDTNITIHLRSTVQMASPEPAGLRGKALPDLGAAGLTTRDAPANQPVLALLIDAEQRPCRRVLRLLGDQAPALKQKGVAVVVLQSGVMADEAFIAWKQEAASPFPIARLKQEPEQARAAWGARALPWFILTDKSHRVIAEGFTLDDLDAKLRGLK